MSAKFKTALVVLVLSILIWVFAESQVTQDDTVEVKVVLKNIREDLEVHYIDEEGKELLKDFQYVTLTVEGSGGRIKEAQERQENIEIPFEIHKMIPELPTTTKDYEVSAVEKLLGQKLLFENIYLKVIKSDPEELRVRIIKLVQRNLVVKVYTDDYSKELSPEFLEPKNISAFVRSGDKIPEVLVTLTNDQQKQAIKETMSSAGKVLLPSGPKEFPIQVKLLESEGLRLPQTISLPKYRLLIPPTMAAQYTVVIENEQILQDPITFRGSLQAENAFQKQNYHLILEIKDGDQTQKQIVRPIRYDIPQEYIGQLEIVDPKTPVQFHLKSNSE